MVVLLKEGGLEHAVEIVFESSPHSSATSWGSVELLLLLLMLLLLFLLLMLLLVLLWLLLLLLNVTIMTPIILPTPLHSLLPLFRKRPRSTIWRERSGRHSLWLHKRGSNKVTNENSRHFFGGGKGWWGVLEKRFFGFGKEKNEKCNRLLGGEENFKEMIQGNRIRKFSGIPLTLSNLKINKKIQAFIWFSHTFGVF